jgi:hypothetical protein
MDTFCPSYEDNPGTLSEIARVQILRAIGVVSERAPVGQIVHVLYRETLVVGDSQARFYFPHDGEPHRAHYIYLR